MDGINIPCYNCGWQAPITNITSYGKEGVTVTIRCTKCDWHGTFKLSGVYETVKEGRDHGR